MLRDHASGVFWRANFNNKGVQISMSEKEATNNQELYEKSQELHSCSRGLLHEARDLCDYSENLRAMNAILVATNASPNSARNRNTIWATLQRASRPRISFSVDIQLSSIEQISNKQRSKR